MNLPFHRALKQWRLLRQLRAVRRSEILILCGQAIAMIGLEIAGAISIYPVLKFAELGSSPEAFAVSSSANATIHNLLLAIGIPLSLATLSLLSLTLIVSRQVMNLWFVLSQESIKHTITQRLTYRSYTAVFGTEASFLRAMSSGEFSQLCTSECNMAGTLIRTYSNILSIGLTLVVYSTAIIIAAPAASIATIAVLGLVSMGLSLYNEKIKQISFETLQATRKVSGHLIESFKSWRLIKLSTNIERVATRFIGLHRRVADLTMRMNRRAGVSRLLFFCIAFLALLASINYLVTVAKHDFAFVAVFAVFVVRLQPIMQTANTQFNSLINADPALERIAKLVSDAEHRQQASGTAPMPTRLDKSIGIHDVSFTYPGAVRPALDGISCRIPAGKVVAIIGRSGSGKSTFVDLLPRIIDPDYGQISIDGTPLHDIDLTSLRTSIAFVFQESLMIDASIAENIAYFDPTASIDDIREAAAAAALSEFIESLPLGYASLVGEAGANLSGGQRQRLNIARAFLKRPAILILDEPTSSLDIETDEAIRQSIHAYTVAHGTTTIIIAHRMSTIRDADYVIRLDNGRVVAQGAPDHILSKVLDEDISG